MGPVNALLDTNILIDYLNGVAAARDELERYAQPVISPISWMEVMVGTTADDESSIRRFLAGFRQVVIDRDIAERAVVIRRTHRLRLPDAIIWASAQHERALLVTRNSKDFPPEEPGIRVPYRL
ncbi:MAG: type II toxin-antitoxin system VapC family toxin [Gammaproteobacteria bacterium]|nr:type II toxin-antitoxin system VapC family toxin [Gammaproteobacteria bacterium]